MEATPRPRSLPPGMVVAKPNNPSSTRSQGSRISPVPLPLANQTLGDECSDDICDHKPEDWVRSKAKRKLEASIHLTRDAESKLVDKNDSQEPAIEAVYQRERESETLAKVSHKVTNSLWFGYDYLNTGPLSLSI